jgi:hypothetical protein
MAATFQKSVVLHQAEEAIASARTIVQAVGAIRAHGFTRCELTTEESHAYTLALVLLTQQIKQPLADLASIADSQ